jgi:hypothetical protein
MKKIFTLSLAALLIAPLFGSAASAKKPVKTTLYFHGPNAVGEADFPDTVSGLWRTMDATKPTDGNPKSVALVAAGAAGTGTPNPQCAGSPFFPVWVGDVTGTIKGTVKASIDVVSSPAVKLDVRLWGFVPSLACNESYADPAAEVRVDVPPGAGTLDVVFKNVNMKAIGNLMIQYTPILEGATAARFLYDSTASVSQIQFTCIPSSGSSCTP